MIITPTNLGVSGGEPWGFVVQWLNATENDTLLPYGGSLYQDCSIDVIGVLGSGATWGVQGTNDPAKADSSFKTLRDPFGNLISGVSKLDIMTIVDHCIFVRPTMTGTGNSLTFNMKVSSPTRR